MKIAKSLLVLNVFGTIAWVFVSFQTRNPLWLILAGITFSGAVALVVALRAEPK